MNFLRQHRNKIIILLILLVGGFWGVNRLKATASTTTVKLDTKKDTIVTPETKDIKEDLVLAGSINASEIASLRFKNSGKMNWVGVKVGDRVKKFQALASLDRVELQKSLQTQYNDYRTQLSQFQDTQDTYKTTRDNALVTDTIQRILDRTQYSLNNSVIDYEIADMAIKEAVLTTPISGVVVNVEQPLSGTYITPATATFTVINPESIYFRAEIDQEEVVKIRVGQKAKIKLDSFSNETIDSEITYISFTPVTGQTSTVYEIRFRLPLKNNDLTYRLGMDGDATITLQESSQVLSLPTEAINQDDSGQNYVWLKKDSELIRQNVTLGTQNDQFSEIKEGVSPNDQVVIKKR